jgi:hypothetical protein
LGHLQVVTNVPNAKVSLNDKKRGLVDAQGVLNISNLAQKKVEIIVSADGYQAHRQSINLTPGQWKTISIQLQPLSTQNETVVQQHIDNSQKPETLKSCFKNERMLIHTQVSFQALNAEQKTKSQLPELNAVISNVLKKHHVEVIDAGAIAMNEYKQLAKQYNASYLLAIDVNVSESPITTVKTKMKTMQGDLTLRIINPLTGQVLASNTRTFTKAGIKMRQVIKKVIQHEINSSVKQLLVGSCHTTKLSRKSGFFTRAKSLLNF